MRYLILLAALVVGTSAQAQTTGCAAQWSRLSGLLERGDPAPAPGIVRMTADGGCQINAITLDVDRHLTLKADSLRWSGTDLERFAAEGLPPTSLALQVSGITLAPVIGDKTFDYLQNIRARGSKMSLSVVAEWDAEKQVISLLDLRLSWPNDDFVSLQGEMEGVDLKSKNSMQASMGRFALTTAKLTVRSERMFQDFVLIPLGMALLEGAEDPEARVKELKAEGRDVVDNMPPQFISPGSKAALKSLIADLPEPRGELTIVQNASPGIGLARVLPFVMNPDGFRNITDIFSLLDGLQIDVTYDAF